MTRAVTDTGLLQLADTELTPSAWLQITQDRIDAFAEVTGDRQFIHVDPARAARGRFGTTIAHGFLTLSLLSALEAPDWPEIEDQDIVVNYGLDRVRFLRPVAAGARVRVLTRILAVTEKRPREFLVRSEKTVEIEGGDRPALVAVQLTLLIGRPR